MSGQEILEQCNRIFIDQLDNPKIKLKRETTSEDIEEWDSLVHIQLIVAIEKYFKIKFTAAEIIGYRNIGEMCDAIERKMGGK